MNLEKMKDRMYRHNIKGKHCFIGRAMKEYYLTHHERFSITGSGV